MTDPPNVLIALGAITGVTLSIRAVVGGVLRYQENRLKYGAPIHGATEARLERMEHAVDAIAIEIERISEGQRFTTRLLSERAVRD